MLVRRHDAAGGGRDPIGAGSEIDHDLARNGAGLRAADRHGDRRLDELDQCRRVRPWHRHRVARGQPVARVDQHAVLHRALDAEVAIGLGEVHAVVQNGRRDVEVTVPVHEGVARRTRQRRCEKARLHLIWRVLGVHPEVERDGARSDRRAEGRAGADEVGAADSRARVLVVDGGARVGERDHRPPRRDQIGLVEAVRRRGAGAAERRHCVECRIRLAEVIKSAHRDDVGVVAG